MLTCELSPEGYDKRNQMESKSVCVVVVVCLESTSCTYLNHVGNQHRQHTHRETEDIE